MIEFREDTHEYFLDGRKLISVTQLMRKHGLAPNYDAVPTEVLRAKAERGTLIHKEIETFIKQGENGFTAEFFSFIQYMAKNPVEIHGSEQILHNDIVAGTADLLLYENGEYIIADIKTTAALHKEPISWQLSIYAELMPGIEIKRGQAFHFDKEGALKVVDIPLKPSEEVKRLLDCERNGTVYTQAVVVNENKLEQLAQIESIIKTFEEKKKAAERQAQELRQAIMDAMEKSATKSIETDKIKLTYVEPTTRTSVDGARLKAEMPEIAEKYTKTSQVKASLRITLKGDKENES